MLTPKVPANTGAKQLTQLFWQSALYSLIEFKLDLLLYSYVYMPKVEKILTWSFSFETILLMSSFLGFFENFFTLQNLLTQKLSDKYALISGV